MTTGSRWISDPQWVGVGLALALRCNATASTTATTAVGEGFCESFHELPAQDSAEDCHAAIADNGACQAADEFSYGIPTGTRARQCLCDTVGSCPPSSGLDLGENGFKRMRASTVADCDQAQPVLEGEDSSVYSISLTGTHSRATFPEPGGSQC